MVSLNGWLDGGSALAIVIFTVACCVIFLYRSKKLDLRLIAIAGIMILSVGLIYTGPSADLMSLILTDTNLQPTQLYGLIAYVWVAPALICGMYIGAELLMPHRKKIILAVYIVLGVLFEYFLFFDTANTFNFTTPAPLSGDLIDSQFRLTSPTFILTAIFLLSVLLFNGVGFLQKARQQEGKIRRNFTLLALAFIIFTVTGALDAFVPAGAGLVAVRIGMIVITVLLYYGLKPT